MNKLNSLFAPMVVLLSVGLVACGDDDATTAADANAATDAPAAGDAPDAPADGADVAACPEGTEALGELCAIAGRITTDLTLNAGKDYILNGPVFIGDGAAETVLTIEAGVTLYGLKDPGSPGTLIIDQASRIEANGTADAPIVFTSDQLEGSRARGDWGGIIINGRAPINGCDAAPCSAEGEGSTGTYGGDDPTDNSGTLRYVRVEYAGTLFSEDNELNGIAFQGVGSGTTVEYVQVHMSSDDGIEFFGGTVSVKYAVLTGIGDDSMDWTDGWSGNAQFVLAKQAEDLGDNGIEADNNKANNDFLPRSNPTLANLTLLGNSNTDIGALLREGTGATIVNSTISGFADACLVLDNEATFQNSCDSADSLLNLSNVVLNCETPIAEPEDFTPSCTAESIFTRGEGNLTTQDAILDNYLPVDGSVLVTSGVTELDGDWFEAVDFIGAVGSEDWTAGWTVGL